MRPFISLVAAVLLALLVVDAGHSVRALVVDDATGRKVEIPDQVAHVFPAGPPAAALLYAIAPEKMLGWAHAPEIRAWNPDVIVVLGTEAAQAFQSDPRMKDLAAPPRRLFISPTLPFGWVDGPPSPSRLLALKWLGNALYPKLFPDDIRATTRSFYHLFYQVDLTEAQLDELLR